MAPQNVLQELLVPWNGSKRCIDYAADFSRKLGWYPSDIIENKKNDSIATGHLLVEHGLDNAAVISFVNSKYLLTNNDYSQLKNKLQLLEISYNNLIDYHIIVDSNKINALHNRISHNDLIFCSETQNFESTLRSDYFINRLDNRTFKTDILPLDDALIKSISYWKRYLYSEFNGEITNEELSNFFNAIIFARALEDGRKLPNAKSENKLKQLLWQKDQSFSEIIDGFYRSIDISWPNDVINKSLLTNIDKISRETLDEIFRDFYKSKDSPYNYDFSIISKHALSMIYEKYVAVLNMPEKLGQTSLFDFSPTPIETLNKPTGSYYTPQFIARFFSRYIEKVLPEIFQNKDIKILEPAVGSGIFIRTILENQLENPSSNPELLNSLFNNITSLDINRTACDATALSLNLLYLVSTNRLPEHSLNILNVDTIEYFNKYPKEKFNIIISNPPYIKYSSLNEQYRASIKTFLSNYSFNKSDLYLAFIKIGITNLEDNGISLFVLPSTFLITESSKHIRRLMQEECNILCIVDLSNVEYKIFEEADIYPILLVFQKKKKALKSFPQAIIADIKENIGNALTDILDDNYKQNNAYSIYTVPQEFFTNEKWQLLPPDETELVTKLSLCKTVDAFFNVRTGFSSGNTNVFIRSKSSIPKHETALYKPYLSDREMLRFKMPESVHEYVFYPYINREKITEDVLMKDFPLTYTWLLRNKRILLERNEVKQNKLEWWMPNRSRKPDFMLVPKIVIPHLVFIPRFSYDLFGEYAVSRSPFIVIKNEASIDPDFYFFILGILNSSVCTWFMLKMAPKYQKGYAMLEPKTVSRIPIPDPLTVDKTIYLRFVTLAKERFIINCSDVNRIVDIEKQLDEIAFYMYRLNNDDIKVILGEYGYKDFRKRIN